MKKNNKNKRISVKFEITCETTFDDQDGINDNYKLYNFKNIIENILYQQFANYNGISSSIKYIGSNTYE